MGRESYDEQNYQNIPFKFYDLLIYQGKLELYMPIITILFRIKQCFLRYMFHGKYIWDKQKYRTCEESVS